MKEWIKLPVVKDSTGLYINNLSIVEAWERPIQEQLAKSVCIGDHLEILEIGYGLGLSTRTVHTYCPKSHILIEAHPDIAKNAKLELPNSTSIIVAFWEDAVKWFKDEIFDGIIFDSYPFAAVPYNGTTDSTFEFIKDFLQKGGRVLKKGGRLAFLDFSCKVHTISKFKDICEERFSAFTAISVPLSIPKQCTYASGNSGNIIVLTK